MPSKPKVDPEDFLAWKEHPLTQLVLSHYSQQAELIQQRAGQGLLQSSTSSAAEWASQQAQGAYLRALSEAYGAFANVTLEEIQPEEDE
jgi:uncharacterized phage-associated protein